MIEEISDPRESIDWSGQGIVRFIVIPPEGL